MTALGLKIVPLREDMVEDAGAVIARAFQDEPLYEYVFPDPEERARVLPWHFARAGPSAVAGIGIAQDDPANQPLELKAVLHEIPRQPVQEFRMARGGFRNAIDPRGRPGPGRGRAR